MNSKIIIVMIITFSVVIVSTITPVFSEASYEILENRFYNQPIVCIYEPDVPNATQIIKDLWVSETELGVKDWQYELQSTEYSDKNKWGIEIQEVSLDLQLTFDNKDCDVEIRFDATAPNAAYAGVHWFEGNKSQIRIVYTDLEVCRAWSDDNYRYQEWCYKEDYIRSKEIGNIATHEFGHALGLEHYKSDNPNENKKWSSDPYASPSVMTLAVHYNEEKNKIRKIDVDKVKGIYGNEGFGKAKETTLQEIPILEEKNLGGFDTFFVSQTEYLKERGDIKFVTIGGKVTEEIYSRGQYVLITITFPDGEKKELKALTQKNKQFGIQMRIDNTIQIGKYALEAKYMGYDSKKIIFSILDGITNKIQTKDEIVIPNWIKNNAKWWGEGIIKDREFVIGMQYLMQQGIIKMDNVNSKQTKSIQEIPQWVKNNAKWWGEGLITDADFVQGMKYLVQQKIISVN